MYSSTLLHPEPKDTIVARMRKGIGLPQSNQTRGPSLYRHRLLNAARCVKTQLDESLTTPATTGPGVHTERTAPSKVCASTLSSVPDSSCRPAKPHDTKGPPVAPHAAPAPQQSSDEEFCCEAESELSTHPHLGKTCWGAASRPDKESSIGLSFALEPPTSELNESPTEGELLAHGAEGNLLARGPTSRLVAGEKGTLLPDQPIANRRGISINSCVEVIEITIEEEVKSDRRDGLNETLLTFEGSGESIRLPDPAHSRLWQRRQGKRALSVAQKYEDAGKKFEAALAGYAARKAAIEVREELIVKALGLSMIIPRLSGTAAAEALDCCEQLNREHEQLRKRLAEIVGVIVGLNEVPNNATRGAAFAKCPTGLTRQKALGDEDSETPDDDKRLDRLSGTSIIDGPKEAGKARDKFDAVEAFEEAQQAIDDGTQEIARSISFHRMSIS